MNLFAAMAFENPFYYFSWIFVVMFSICVHEYAHAATALRRGDNTAALLGHLSLNPLKQMGVQSLVMLVLFGVAWGAVPVNPRRLKSSASEAMVALAGPLANLVLVLFFTVLLLATDRWLPVKSVTSFCWLAAQANGILFLLNMLPVPPLVEET